MKRIALLLAAGLALAAAAAFGSAARPFLGDLQIQTDAKNPWTNLKLNNDPNDFQFVVVSDRTGGHRANIFSKAIEQINLLQPEFVLSVGDLIEGYSEKRDELETQWGEFNSYVGKLQMPFFYVPGNHDTANATQQAYWIEQFGRPYYHFVYRGVLFLMLHTEDFLEGKKGSYISPTQIAYVKKTLAENAGVRWTVVCLHKPIWTDATAAEIGWTETEKLLGEGDRPFTVFAGHVHRYEKFVRNGRSFYQLATTGGGSKLRGEEYGEFDQVAWVTMKKNGPVIANLCLDGILSENLTRPLVNEPGRRDDERLNCLPVRGRVYLNGKPVAGAQVVFHYIDMKTKAVRRGGDGRTDADGAFIISTYTANDGAPAGEYLVTVTQSARPNPAERGDGVNRLPAKYAKAPTSGLTANVKVGSNDFLFELKD